MRIDVVTVCGTPPYDRPIRVDVDGVPYFQETDTRLCHRRIVREDDVMPETAFCSVCDAILDRDDVFCSRCGSKVVGE